MANNRYNDKNVSATIDINFQDNTRLRSISEGINNLKPKNFRIMSKRDKDANSRL